MTRKEQMCADFLTKKIWKRTFISLTTTRPALGIPRSNPPDASIGLSSAGAGILTAFFLLAIIEQ